jgi:sec-independent protein translocase protein TatA
MGLKWTEILLILFALMLLFGSTRLPQLGQSLGSAIRNFKKGFAGEVEEKDEKKLAESTGTPAAQTDKVSSKQS